MGSEIAETARQMIDRHGLNAAARAELRVAACEREGHQEAADIWRRIIATIRQIQEPTTGSP
jgi:hypothetical protein